MVSAITPAGNIVGIGLAQSNVQYKQGYTPRVYHCAQDQTLQLNNDTHQVSIQLLRIALSNEAVKLKIDNPQGLDFFTKPKSADDTSGVKLTGQVDITLNKDYELFFQSNGSTIFRVVNIGVPEHNQKRQTLRIKLEKLN